jgi:small-conductance mechanosensitive channel
VYADPRATGAGPAIATKTAMAVATWRDIDALHRAVNSVRERRKALKAANDPDGRDAKLAAIEEQLMQVNMNGSEANLAFPGMLNEQYAAFAQGLEDADTPPTRQQTALFDSLHERLQAQLTALAALK